MPYNNNMRSTTKTELILDMSAVNDPNIVYPIKAVLGFTKIKCHHYLYEPPYTEAEVIVPALDVLIPVLQRKQDEPDGPEGWEEVVVAYLPTCHDQLMDNGWTYIHHHRQRMSTSLTNNTVHVYRKTGEHGIGFYEGPTPLNMLIQ